MLPETQDHLKRALIVKRELLKELPDNLECIYDLFALPEYTESDSKLTTELIKSLADLLHENPTLPKNCLIHLTDKTKKDGGHSHYEVVVRFGPKITPKDSVKFGLRWKYSQIEPGDSVPTDGDITISITAPSKGSEEKALRIMTASSFENYKKYMDTYYGEFEMVYDNNEPETI